MGRGVTRVRGGRGVLGLQQVRGVCKTNVRALTSCKVEGFERAGNRKGYDAQGQNV
jgi:hypothetical protein